MFVRPHTAVAPPVVVAGGRDGQHAHRLRPGRGGGEGRGGEGRGGEGRGGGGGEVVIRELGNAWSFQVRRISAIVKTMDYSKALLSISLHANNSSLEGATELKLAQFCSS